LSKTIETVVFSHGKESGPWGSKITAMAEVVRELGLSVESVDYRGMDDPGARVQKLIDVARPWGTGVVLAGSSLGGHVSAAAASTLKPRGIFLLAPAFYMPGYEQYTPQEVAAPTAIVHGWHDDIVPVANSIRWAGEHDAELHILNSGHRLEDQIPAILTLLRAFLRSLMAS
jgi:pimeloyl-ACP methyl ester carboxylesterase